MEFMCPWAIRQASQSFPFAREPDAPHRGGPDPQSMRVCMECRVLESGNTLWGVGSERFLESWQFTAFFVHQTKSLLWMTRQVWTMPCDLCSAFSLTEFNFPFSKSPESELSEWSLSANICLQAQTHWNLRIATWETDQPSVQKLQFVKCWMSRVVIEIPRRIDKTLHEVWQVSWLVRRCAEWFQTTCQCQFTCAAEWFKGELREFWITDPRRSHSEVFYIDVNSIPLPIVETFSISQKLYGMIWDGSEIH
jgi:hypothetical protein